MLISALAALAIGIALQIWGEGEVRAIGVAATYTMLFAVGWIAGRMDESP